MKIPQSTDLPEGLVGCACADPPGCGLISRLRRRAEIAQLVEHATENRGVASSNLALGTKSFWSRSVARKRSGGSSSVVEHHLAKVRVAGPNPVFRSIPSSHLVDLTASSGAPSSSGKTPDFGSVNRGSNPRGAATSFGLVASGGAPGRRSQEA